VVVGFRGGGQDVTAHVLAELLGTPTERQLIELRHAIPIVKRHLEVNDALHHIPPVHFPSEYGRIAIHGRNRLVCEPITEAARSVDCDLQ